LATLPPVRLTSRRTGEITGCAGGSEVSPSLQFASFSSETEVPITLGAPSAIGSLQGGDADYRG